LLFFLRISKLYVLLFFWWVKINYCFSNSFPLERACMLGYECEREIFKALLWF
jgi:hypothetical protein